MSKAAMAGGRHSAGFTYVGLLFFVLLAGVGLAVAGHWWHLEIRRDREKELLFVGDQFRRAIASYHASLAGKNQYPQTLEDLIEDRRQPNPVRHLRQIYRDPMTGKSDWTLLKEQERIIGVSSRSEDKPIKAAGFPERYQDFSNATSYNAWRFIHRLNPIKGDPATNPPLDGGNGKGTLGGVLGTGMGENEEGGGGGSVDVPSGGGGPPGGQGQGDQ